MERPVTLTLVTNAKRRMAVSVRKHWPDLRAGVKLSTSLSIMLFDDGIFADLNRILCANHLPDVKSVINLSFKRTWSIYLTTCFYSFTYKPKDKPS